MLQGTETKDQSADRLNLRHVACNGAVPTLFDIHIERHTHTHRHIVENCCWRRQSLLRLGEDCQ